MAGLYNPIYKSGLRSGTSGAEVSDLRPEQAYDTDLRRIDAESRDAVSPINDNQDRVAKFLKSAKSAEKYKQKALIDEPSIRGKTPRTEASIEGSTLPSMGDRFGRGGGTNYANKPQPKFGAGF